MAKASRQTKFFSARAISLRTVDIPSIRGRSPVLERLKIALDSLCAHIGFSLCFTNQSQEIRKNEAVTYPNYRGERDHQVHISIYKSPYPRHLSHRLNSEDPSDKHATREPYSWASVGDEWRGYGLPIPRSSNSRVDVNFLVHGRMTGVSSGRGAERAEPPNPL